MIEDFVCSQGSSVEITGTLRDSAGNPILNTYDGTESLVSSVWPGGPRPETFAPTTTWIDPAAGTFLVAITKEQTALLYTGIYQGLTRVASGSDRPDAFYFTLTVAPGPGGIPAAPTSAAITRLPVEVELVDRGSALLLLCGKSVMADGNNRFLTGAIGFALQKLGVTPAVPGVVSDADLAQVPPSKFFLLCDLGEYRMIRSLLSNFAQPDQTSGNTKIHLNSMTDRFRNQMLDLEKQYASYLGTDRATLATGSIRVRQSSCGWPRGGCSDF